MTSTVTVNCGTLGLSYDFKGKINKVVPGGQAARKGIKLGWTLIKVGNTPVTTRGQITTAFSSCKRKKKPYTLTFKKLSGKLSVGGKKTVLASKEETENEKKISKSTATKASTTTKTTKSGKAKKGGKKVVKKKKGTDDNKKEVSEEVQKEEEKKEEEKKEEEKKEDVVGNVKIIYSMYDQEFEIVNGSTTAEKIDDEYALTFVMPKCKIRLTLEKNAGMNPSDLTFVKEEPEGTYQGLEVGKTYYAYCDEDAEEKAKAEAKSRAYYADSNNNLTKPEDVTGDRNGGESCSCVWGNPCVSPYNCKNWHNRFAVAKANGWKGHS